MPEYDLLVRGATPHPAIGITGGVIAGLDEAPAREEIDATGLLVLPGAIDAHVHFNEPGRTDWEGWWTGSRAAVAGGATTVCDMPLNSLPPVVTPDAFDAKRTAAEHQSCCDFALWGGLVPGHLDDLAPLAERGVIGFKAFMAESGVEDFPRADLETLAAGMRRAAALGRVVAVHAELERPALRRGTTVADYLASRPIESECAAIRAALVIAADTGCRLHVVHVSSAEGVALIAEARAAGQDVTAETCPHYLVLTDADMETQGAVAKCAPPLRPDADRRALLEQVRAGLVDTIGSDHSPAPWHLKIDTDFYRVWGGISGVQHLVPLVIDAGLDPALVARVTAGRVAARFGLRSKGRIETGYDADLTLVEIGHPVTVTRASLLYRHPHSPYEGRVIRAQVRRTILRGRTVFHEGVVTASGGGRLLMPS